MLIHQFSYTFELSSRKSFVVYDLHLWKKPELRRGFCFIYMNMRQLFSFVAVEVKLISIDSQNCRQSRLSD